jgi:hypothetical protein
MAIVRRHSPKKGTYYYDTTNKVMASESAWRRSQSAKKTSKTQFKTAKGYACESAARTMGKRPKGTGASPTRSSSKAGRILRSCR